MASNAAIPLPLQLAIDRLPAFIDSISRSRPGLIRAMRPERREGLIKFLTSVLLSCSLQHDGAICSLSAQWARPKTVEELAEESGISFSQAKRCLGELREREYITSKQIKRKNRINGQFEVSPGLRFLTGKFWEALGLLDLYKKSMIWAKKHCRRQFIMPFKPIGLAEKTIRQAKDIVGNVLKNLSDGAMRAQFMCDKIRKNLRKQK